MQVRGIGRARFAWLLVLPWTLLGACGGHERPERVEQTAPSASSTATPSAVETSAVARDTAASRPAPESGESAILDILRTANTIAIRSARLARARSTNEAIQTYAVQIVEDHTAANTRLSRLSHEIGVRPQATPTSRTLRDDADHARAAFETKRGATFDRAYIENEIEFHRRVLELLDRQLIPAAADSLTRDLLLTQRSSLAAHLDHASHVHDALAP